MELIVRLHRFCREQNRPYRIVFQPDPVVWTEAPETRSDPGAAAQSVAARHAAGARTASRHAGQPALWPHRPGGAALLRSCSRRSARSSSCVALVVTVVGLALGLVDWEIAKLSSWRPSSTARSSPIASVLLEELSFRRYLRLLDVFKLLAAAVLENFGYRQLTTLVAAARDDRLLAGRTPGGER